MIPFRSYFIVRCFSCRRPLFENAATRSRRSFCGSTLVVGVSQSKSGEIQCFDCFNSENLFSELCEISTLEEIYFSANLNMFSIFQLCFADWVTVIMKNYKSSVGFFEIFRRQFCHAVNRRIYNANAYLKFVNKHFSVIFVDMLKKNYGSKVFFSKLRLFFAASRIEVNTRLLAKARKIGWKFTSLVNPYLFRPR